MCWTFQISHARHIYLLWVNYSLRPRVWQQTYMYNPRIPSSNNSELTSCQPGIDKSLALERKIESRKRNFSLDLENLIFSISLSTLDFREWQQKILFPLSIFESGKKKFSFYSRFSRVWYWNSRFFSRFLRVQIESSTSFIADGSKLINLNLFQRSDFTFSHLILIQNFKPVSLRHLKYSNSECLPP